MKRARRAAALALLGALAVAAPAAADKPITALAPFEIYVDGFKDLRGITVDAAGNVYVADRKADTATRIAPNRSQAIIASGLKNPTGLVLAPTGLLLIAEEKAGRVVRVEANGSLTTLASGIDKPRWLAGASDGTIYIAAKGLSSGGGDDDDEDDDDGPRVIIRRDPASGALTVVASGIRKLEGLVLNGTVLYAAAKRVEALPQANGVIVRYPVQPDGSLGTPTYFVSGGLKTPTGLALDRLGALYVSAKELNLGGTKFKRAIGKVDPDGRLTRFAENLEDPQGLAFDATGNLYVAEGKEGLVVRFLAPAAPALDSLPAFTNQSPFPVTGTTEANARVDLFVNDAPAPVTGTADATGAFTLSVSLTPNAENRLQVLATPHAGDGLTSTPAEATLTHDGVAPSLAFLQPPAGAFVGQTVTAEAQAGDSGSGVAGLSLSADGQALTPALAPAPPAASVTATAAWDTTAAADGTQTLTASATDQAGNTATVTRSVLVDNTSPDTQIVSGPSGEIAVTEATFTFTGTDNLTPAGSLLFAWSLDGGQFTSFSGATTATLTNLAEGPHTFQVKAKDLAGKEDPTPAQRTFTVTLGPSIASVDPSSGPVGTFVTIPGARFTPGPTQVAFNGVAAVLYTVSATRITTTVPLGATTGLLTVTTPKGTASRPFTVTTSGDFFLTTVPARVRAIAGDQGAAFVQAGGSHAFTSLVSLSASAPPAGIAPSLTASLLAPGAGTDLTFFVASTVAPGNYAFTITGQAEVDGQLLTRTAPVTLEVLAPETQAITGRVLTAEALPQPIPGVTVTLGSAFTLTDAGGNFVLLAPPAGANMLLVDGRTASTPTAQYPPVEVNLPVGASGPTRVPFIIYLPRLDTPNPVTLPLDTRGATTQEVRATTPTIPGLEVIIPPGTRITGPDGNPVAQITLTPVPVDRSPMPFPPGVTAAQLFTIQPGGAVPSQPLPITFPNVQQAPPGTKADLYFFDLATGGWAVWGTGTVSADGTQIVSDPGFGLPRFAWHFPFTGGVSLSDAVRSRQAAGGEPVDLPTGRFTVRKTDLALPGRLPVTIQRFYRSENPRAGLFGSGWDLDLYDARLTTAGTSLRLILPDQSSYLLTPTGPGRWGNQAEPFLRGAVLTQLPGEFNFQLRLKDGTVQRFDRIPTFGNLAGLAKITDRTGNSVIITRISPVFGLFGIITQLTEPGGRVLTFTYDASNRITSITDPIGRTVQYAYDAQGRLVTVRDPAGGVTTYTYDANHRILSITDPRGITFLTNEYAAAGRVARQTQADGGMWSFAYTLAGGLVTETRVTDPRGQATTYRFNAEGFTLSQTDALGQTTAFEYEPGSNLLRATTDPLGRVTRFAYDAQGNVTQIVDPAGGARTFSYEPTFNRVTAITDPLGNVTQFAYDTQGNLTSITDPAGARTTIAYNASGQPTSTTDPLGQTTAFSYDAVGNLTAITDPLGNTTRREYDGATRLTRQVDPRGRATVFAYDVLNRLTALTDALGGLTQFSYDGNGNLLTVTDARGSVTTHTYDSMDRLATRTDPVGASESFQYDGLGNLLSHTDRKGQGATFSYDALNRRTGASYADGSTTSFTYDAVGRLLQASDSVGGSILNTYDTLDRLVSQTASLGTVSYAYDALGRRTRMDAPGQASVFYGYDAASRLTAITQAPLNPVTLEYDLSGRRTRLTLPNGVATDYQYDAASRLTELIYRNTTGVLGNLTYTYDAASNRTKVGGSFARTLLPDAVATATYDPANRQLAFGDKAMTYDANGNLTSITDPSGLTTFTWDARNSLIALNDPSAIASFVYDPLRRRLAKTVNGSTTHYLYDGPDLVQQLDPLGTTTYLRSLNIDEMFSFTNQDGTFSSIADPLGSTVAFTDSAASVVEYTYNPFGATSSSNPSFPNPFKYTGREHDGPTGLYFLRARSYSPTLHRFISEDPLGLAGGDVNLYTYVDNNPINFTDPLGLLSFSTFGGVQLKGVLTPFFPFPCCGVQGSAGYRFGTTSSSPSAVAAEAYADVQGLLGYGISGGKGAQVGFAFANVEELPQLVEVGLDTPFFSASVFFRNGQFLIPIGGAIGGPAPFASVTVAHPDFATKAWSRGVKFDWKDVLDRILGPPGAGNPDLSGRKK